MIRNATTTLISALPLIKQIVHSPRTSGRRTREVILRRCTYLFYYLLTFPVHIRHLSSDAKLCAPEEAGVVCIVRVADPYTILASVTTQWRSTKLCVQAFRLGLK